MRSPPVATNRRDGLPTRIRCSVVPPSFAASASSETVAVVVCRRANPFLPEMNPAILSITPRASSDTYATGGVKGFGRGGADGPPQPATNARAVTAHAATPIPTTSLTARFDAMTLPPMVRVAAAEGHDRPQYTFLPTAAAARFGPGHRSWVTRGPSAAAVRNQAASMPVSRA